MDPEQTFIRVQERFSQILNPRIRAFLEYTFLFLAITLFCILVVMHANYVQQPGCSSELTGVELSEAELLQIKITSAGLWSRSDESTAADVPQVEASADNLEVSKNDQESCASEEIADNTFVKVDREEPRSSFSVSAKETVRAAILRFPKKFYRRISFVLHHTARILRGVRKIWNIVAIPLNLDMPKLFHVLYMDKVNYYAVQWLERRTQEFEPTYLYTMEKGYFLLPDEAKSRHNIRTANVSISARHPCFGNRLQQLTINRVVGYDTIIMNSLQNSAGQGYMYNFQTREFYNLSYSQELSEGSSQFGDYLVTKCGVLMMSLFVFFTTTMSVSFTLRETQTRMLKFTVQLQHHAQHRLPTFQLIFVHVIESLVFVPIMIGILFFLFEFYDDQLLAFMVLVLVWLCELFTLISVRTPISMKFFPRFFLLYFLVFHIYFFSYAYGFSYLALMTTGAFMQHLILYFWNRFEVPALQRFLQSRQSHLHQHPDFHITSSTILASTLHITRLNRTTTRNRSPSGPNNTTPNQNTETRSPAATAAAADAGVENPMQHQQQEVNTANANIPVEPNPHAGAMSSFSSMLLRILGGASSEGFNSFLSRFRDTRDEDEAQAFADTSLPNAHHDNLVVD
ncbi:membralin-like protein At1g60995 [Raphanus sativus]|uniref:Membralin-like protein At1g60995 n=1 Tax=Raphanus sativus TaxID=3726 RepID=A0A9W3C2P0_RAPSA|nr:membralin-like protein At1g60995 [Raphanus sativus]